MKKHKKFAEKNLILIHEINNIITWREYRGLKIRVKGLHTDLSAMGFIGPEKSDYKRLVKVISEARTAGLVPWNAIAGRKQIRKGKK